MRPRGAGTIEELPNGGGFRARMPGRGVRLPVTSTRDESERLLAAALDAQAALPASGRLTVGTWGTRAIEAREIAGQRSARDYGKVWRSQVLSCWLGNVELRALRKSDVVAWTKELATRRKMPGRGHGDAAKAKAARTVISKSTAQNALNVLRSVLRDALDDDQIEENPAIGVELPTAIRNRARTEETWTYLEFEELVRLLSAPIPIGDLLAIAFSVGMGSRQTETWRLRWRDIDTRAGLVTFRKTKLGKPRTVPLLPLAAKALEIWRGLAPSTKPHSFVWTALRGGKRTGELDRWDEYLRLAGLAREKRRDGRNVRWHDLRHTCGTSLIQGWFGEPWAREAVQEQLGHTNAETTERYAHLAGTLAQRAARAMGALPNDLPKDPRANLTQVLGIIEAAPRRIERPTNGLGSRGEVKRVSRLRATRGMILGTRDHLASLSAGWDALEWMAFQEEGALSGPRSAHRRPRSEDA
jgi:integrase